MNWTKIRRWLTLKLVVVWFTVLLGTVALAVIGMSSGSVVVFVLCAGWTGALWAFAVIATTVEVDREI